MMQPLSCYINHLSGWVRADHTHSVVWMSAPCCAATMEGRSAERQARAAQSEQHYFIKEPLAGVKRSARTQPRLAAATRSEATRSTPTGHRGNFTPSDPEPINGAAASGLPVSCLGLFYAAACNVPRLVQFPVRAAPVLVKANVLCLFIAHRRHQVYCGVLALLDRRNSPDFARQRENVTLLVTTW